MNRKQKAIRLLNEMEDTLICPFCHEVLKVEEERSLKCSKNHTFDIAKQGYVNVLSNAVKTSYDKDLFTSRYEVIRNIGFYSELQDELKKAIEKHITKEKMTILDIGCGEGSHLNKVKELLSSKIVTGIGIDISKEGILVAAKNYDELNWLVGDLANIPVNNQSVDVILDILSPSNYKEFLRILAKDGVVIKVVPAREYLKEIREVIFEDATRHRYEQDEKIVDLFHQHFHEVEKISVKYMKQLSRLEMEHLIRMTPLTWNAPNDKIEKLLMKDSQTITIDLEILIGKN